MMDLSRVLSSASLRVIFRLDLGFVSRAARGSRVCLSSLSCCHCAFQWQVNFEVKSKIKGRFRRTDHNSILNKKQSGIEIHPSHEKKAGVKNQLKWAPISQQMVYVQSCDDQSFFHICLHRSNMSNISVIFYIFACILWYITNSQRTPS